MGGRPGLGRVAVGVAALAVFCLLLLPGSHVPLAAGRPPTTPDPDPVGLPPGAPTDGFDEFSVRISPATLAALEVPAVQRSPAYLDAQASLRDVLSTELESAGGEDRSVFDDGSPFDTNEALASVVLVMVAFTAVRNQDQDRRRRAASPGEDPERSARLAPDGPGDRTPVEISA